MMEKILTFPTQTDDGTFFHTIAEKNSIWGFEKTASVGLHPDIASYISNAKPIPGAMQVLLTALGALEYWGSNVNGDGFPEKALLYSGPEYGHKTFETMAHVYKHHINKDPKKAYGKVLLSVWNDKMKRVELIVTIEKDRAPDLIERIDNGEFPMISMGCKVPYDICSICSNRAKTRDQYCCHLVDYMNKIPPGCSKKAYAINTLPKFFDISFVLIGADRIARVMRKIAGVQDIPEVMWEKIANGATQFQDSGITKIAFGLSNAKVAAKKLAEMEKIVPSNLDGNIVGDVEKIGPKLHEALRPLEPDLPKKIIVRMTINGAGMGSLSSILSTLTMMGIVPKRREFQSIALRALGKHKLADDYERLGLVFNPAVSQGSEQGCLCDKNLHISANHFDSQIFQIVKPHMEDKSYSLPLMKNRIIRLVKLAAENKLTYPIGEHVKTAEDEENSFKIGLLPMMLTLAGLYTALRKKAPGMVMEAGAEGLLEKNPALALALGVGAIAGLEQIFGRNVKGKFDYHPDSQPIRVGDWKEEIERKNANPITKTARLSLGKKIFLGVPLIYGASGMSEVKKYRNPQEPESFYNKALRKHPDVISAALIGEHLAGSPISRTIKRYAKKGLNLLRKTAFIDAQRFKDTAIFSLAFPGISLPNRLIATLIDDQIISGIGKLLASKKNTNPRRI